jgi:transposase InsO family protein
VVKDLVARGVCSERRACSLVDAPRATARYRRQVRDDEAALRSRIRELAGKYKRYGVRRILALLRREGWRVNKKRVHRLWKEEGLQRKRKARRKRAHSSVVDMPKRAEYPNHVWSHDFIEDRTERGGKLRMLSVLDEFTRDCLHIRVDRSIGAAKVIASLEWLFMLQGAPAYIRSDNGPELVAKALQKWLVERGAETIYITPGSPWENPYVESFHDKFRDECLNMHVFVDGRHAQEVVEAWRREYNELRPHSSLNYMTPAEFTAHWRRLNETPVKGSRACAIPAGSPQGDCVSLGTLPPSPQDLPLCADPVNTKNEAEHTAPPHSTVFGPATALGSLPSVALSSERACMKVPAETDSGKRNAE